MQTIKTLADFKRALTVGTKIEMVRYNNMPPTELIAGVGTVSKVQTNGVWINRRGRDSYLEFPKASNFMLSIERPGHIEIATPGKNPITLEYRLID